MSYRSPRPVVTVYHFLFLLCASAFLLLAFLAPGELRADGGEHWVAAWATSVQPPNRRSVGPAAAGFEGRTLRMILRPAIGGDRIRLKICNTYGTFSLVLGDIGIASRTSGPDIRPDGSRVITFEGARSIRIAAGTSALSDPISLAAKAGEDLAVDLYLPVSTGAPTMHDEANRTSYVSPWGNYAGAPEWAESTKTSSWYFLCGLDVAAPRSVRAVVVLGDSLTDGARSGLDSGADWPSVLTRRLAGAGRTDIALINAGISGNRLVRKGGVGDSALSRFDRDVLAAPGGSSYSRVATTLGQRPLCCSRPLVRPRSSMRIGNSSVGPMPRGCASSGAHLPLRAAAAMGRPLSRHNGRS